MDESLNARRKVAVVTRTRDRPALLPRALASVASQGIPASIQWVIVNDGGEPGYVEEAAAAAGSMGIETVVLHLPGVGMENASNAGVLASDSELIVLHDDDDTWEPDFLPAATAFLDSNPAYGGVVARSLKIVERLSPGDPAADAYGAVRLGQLELNPGMDALCLADVCRASRFPPIAFVYRRDVAKLAGLYDRTMPVMGDWDFVLRFMSLASIGVVPRTLANYHQRPKAGGVYGNSLTTSRDLFLEMDRYVRDKHMRLDREAGRAGLGLLLSLMGRDAARRRRMKAAARRWLPGFVLRFAL